MRVGPQWENVRGRKPRDLKSAAECRLFSLDPSCAGSGEACALSQIWQIVETDQMRPAVRTSARGMPCLDEKLKLRW